MAPLYSCWEGKFVQPYLGTIWHCIIRFKVHVFFVPVILLSVLIYPTDIHGRNCMYKDVHCSKKLKISSVSQQRTG